MFTINREISWDKDSKSFTADASMLHYAGGSIRLRSPKRGVVKTFTLYDHLVREGEILAFKLRSPDGFELVIFNT